MTCECTERQAIVDVLNAYATCLDTRDWLGLNDVFHPQAVGVYGATLTGRAAIIESIRSFLGRVRAVATPSRQLPDIDRWR